MVHRRFVGFRVVLGWVKIDSIVAWEAGELPGEEVGVWWGVSDMVEGLLMVVGIGDAQCIGRLQRVTGATINDFKPY